MPYKRGCPSDNSDELIVESSGFDETCSNCQEFDDYDFGSVPENDWRIHDGWFLTAGWSENDTDASYLSASDSSTYEFASADLGSIMDYSGFERDMEHDAEHGSEQRSSIEVMDEEEASEGSSLQILESSTGLRNRIDRAPSAGALHAVAGAGADLVVLDSTVQRDEGAQAEGLPLFHTPIFPRSAYNGPIRYDMVTQEFLDGIVEILKIIALLINTATAFALIRDLVSMCSEYSEQEIFYIRDQVRNKLIEEDFSNPDIASLISFVYDWCYVSAHQTLPRVKKIYKPVKYGNLIDAQMKNCSICYEKFKKNSVCMVMDCLHTFHSRCLGQWLKESDCCPFCRALPKG